MCIGWGPALNNSQFSWFCKQITASVSWDLITDERAHGRRSKSKQRKLKFSWNELRYFFKSGIGPMKFYNLITQVIVKTHPHLKSKRNETRQFAGEANWIIVWEDSNSTWRSEGKKSILISLFFRLYCERLSCLSVCFPSSAFHGPIYIFFSSWFCLF